MIIFFCLHWSTSFIPWNHNTHGYKDSYDKAVAFVNSMKDDYPRTSADIVPVNAGGYGGISGYIVRYCDKYKKVSK